jgi:preprotein translocase subunit SecG
MIKITLLIVLFFIVISILLSAKSCKIEKKHDKLLKDEQIKRARESIAKMPNVEVPKPKK